VRKKYVDENFFRRGAPIDMGQKSIRNINPTHEDKIVPKPWIETRFLSRDGTTSTMTGDLIMDGHFITYLKTPEHDHHATTKGYADMKLSLHGEDMQGSIGMSGNIILHLGVPEQGKDAIWLRFVNEYFLRCDGGWMQGNLSMGGHRMTGMANPQRD